MATFLRTTVRAPSGANATGGTHTYGPNVDVACDGCYAPSYDDGGGEANGRCWTPRYGRACDRCGTRC